MINLEENRLDFVDAAEHPEQETEEFERMRTDTWHANDASFSDYCSTAGRMGLPNVAGRVRGPLDEFETGVGLDIAGGANGAALQELIKLGSIDTGIVTNLLDKRSDEARQNENLLHIDGDILESETWQRIFSTVFEASDGVGPSLIMHRPCGALQYLPPDFYEGSFHLLFDWLRPGGVMFTQVPMLFSDSHHNLKLICQNVKGRDDIESLRSSAFASFNYSAVITKAQ